MKTILIQILFTVITVFGIELLKIALKFINAKIDQFQQSKEMKKKDKLNKVIDQVQNFVTYAVEKVANTYVNELKSSGTFTDEAKKKAEMQAIELIKPLMSKEEFEILSSAYEDIEKFLSAKITETVEQNKVKSTTTATQTTTTTV